MSDERQNTRATILKAVENAGELSATVNRVLQITLAPDSSPKELASVIRLDPVITFQVLKLVNSALFGMRKEVTSINQAVVLLGMNTIKNLALSLGVASKLAPKGSGSGEGFNHETFWKHSVAVAIGSTLIARKLNVDKQLQEEFFLAGLLHDMGKVVIYNAEPDQYEKALSESIERMTHLSEVEQEHLGTDHMEVGSLLAERWRFSRAFITGVLGTGQPDPECEKEALLMRHVVDLANDYATRLGYAIDTHHHVPLPDSAWEEVGVDKADMDAFIEEKLPAEFERAQAFLKSLTSPNAST